MNRGGSGIQENAEKGRCGSLQGRLSGALARRLGRVEEVVCARPGYQELRVAVEGQEGLQRAVCFPELSGFCAAGDRVLLNTTAVQLGLGSGGFHFVIARLPREEGQSAPGGGRCETTEPDAAMAGPEHGHIMKLRYTPLQIRVLAVDEEASPHRAQMEKAESLSGQPVVVGSVHSHLVPAVAGIRFRLGHCRCAYVMTDGGALPAAWSASLHWLRQRGYLTGCITAGHAFGGDLEAVNIYSALLAARHVLEAEVTVALMGPGVVGTGSRFGHTALEVCQLIDAVAALGGQPVVIPRLSEGDPRPRHWGVSHHTLTALGLAHARARVVLPRLKGSLRGLVQRQLEEAGVGERHCVVEEDTDAAERSLTPEWTEQFHSMGRRWEDDPAFFRAALAAGVHGAKLAEEAGIRSRRGAEERD